MTILKSVSTIAIVGLLLTSCGETKKGDQNTVDTEVVEDNTAKKMAMSEDQQEVPSIVGVALGNENFETLVTAIKAADLIETLNAEGPLTVFAPTNGAFAKLPKGTVESLLLPENKNTLSELLTYHVVSGKFDAAAVIEAINKNSGKFTVDTVNGKQITLSLNEDKIMLTDAKGGTSTVIMTDLTASNGVIHAIDTVVMPK